MSKKRTIYIKTTKRLPDIYKFYKERKKARGTMVKDMVPKWKFGDVLRRLNEKLVKEVLIEEARSFRMPYKMGQLYAVKRNLPTPLRPDGTIDKKRLVVNWGDTYKLWEKEYGAMRQSEYSKIKGKPLVYWSIDSRVGFKWEKPYRCNKVLSLYSIKLTQAFNRYLGKYSEKDNNKKKYRVLSKKKP